MKVRFRKETINRSINTLLWWFGAPEEYSQHPDADGIHRGSQCLPCNPYRHSCSSYHLDAHRLDCKQEANYGRCLYRCCCQTGSHHSNSRQYRYFRSFLHRYHFHHRLLLHGSGSKGEVQV